MQLLHFAKLKEDMPGKIRKVADFLDIKIDPAKWNDVLEHCSFDYMKKHATKSVPLTGTFWDGGSETFINKTDNLLCQLYFTEDQGLTTATNPGIG